jgi:acetyltransferase EpsM
VIGYGALSQEVYDVTKELDWKVSDYYVEDKYFNPSTTVKVLDQVFNLPTSSSVFVAIGRNFERFRISQEIMAKRPDLLFPPLIHPSTQIASSATIGQGSLVLRNSTISSNARIQDFVLVNNNALVEHDSKVLEYSSVGPKASLLGSTTLGKFSFIGAHSCVLQTRTVGEGSALGAMSLLTSDLPSEQLWIGIPARFERVFDYREDIYAL